MVDISIIEFGVYGLLAYTGMLMLIISSFGKQEQSSTGQALRVVYLVPSMIAALLLSFLGGSSIDMPANIILDVNSTNVWTETHTIDIVNTAWGAIHMLMFLVMLIYVMWNVIGIFTTIWKRN